MNFTKSRSVYVAAVALMAASLFSCKSADRGGVTLTPKIPVDSESEITENKPLSLLSQTTKCLEIPADDYFLNTAAATQVVDCLAERNNQGWILTSREEILSTNGMCLSVADQTESSASAVVEGCDLSTKQKWTLNTLDKTIRNQGFPNLCLDVNSEIVNGVLDGKLLACNGDASQQWHATVLERKRIESVSDPDFFINLEPLEPGGVEHLKVSRVDIKWFSGYWTIEPAGDYYRIRSYWLSDRFLNIEYGWLKVDYIKHYWESAKWSKIKQVEGDNEYYIFRNLWQRDIYLGISEDMTLAAGKLNEIKLGSHRWKITNFKPIQ